MVAFASGCVASSSEVLMLPVSFPMSALRCESGTDTPTESVGTKIAGFAAEVHSQHPEIGQLPVSVSEDAARRVLPGWTNDVRMINLLPVSKASVKDSLRIFCDMADLAYTEVRGQVFIDVEDTEDPQQESGAASASRSSTD
jgi:hypothetical protein